MCCVWVSALNQIDIDVSATKLLLFTSFSHLPTQLCQDYGCCHHSPNPLPLQFSFKCITLHKWRGVNLEEHKHVQQKSKVQKCFFQYKMFQTNYGVTWSSSYSFIFVVLYRLVCCLTSSSPNKHLPDTYLIAAPLLSLLKFGY